LRANLFYLFVSELVGGSAFITFIFPNFTSPWQCGVAHKSQHSKPAS